MNNSTINWEKFILILSKEEQDKINTDINILSNLTYCNKQFISLYKLQYLIYYYNEGWTPDYNKSKIYIPDLCIHKVNEKNNLEFSVNDEYSYHRLCLNTNEVFNVIGGHYTTYSDKVYRSTSSLNGWLNMSSVGCFGNIDLNIGILACKNEEIARFISKNFTQLIFEVFYSNYSIQYTFI